MKKKILAFYDLLVYSIICAPLMVSSAMIFVFGELGNSSWLREKWYLLLLFATGLVLPLGLIVFIKYFEIKNDLAYFYYFTLTTNLEKAAKGIDSCWNQEMHPSEITNVEIVKLTKEEKKKYTSTKFFFNKYLKINLKYGACKYVYVGTYSKFQIKRIIKLLLKSSTG